MHHTGTLKPKQPYDFVLTLSMLAKFPHPTVDITHDGAYWRALRIGDALALFRVTSDDGGTLHVDCPVATGDFDHDAALAKLAHILTADIDLTPFYTFASSDPDLWQLVEPIRGLRWLRTATVYEALMTTIIEQQIAWKTAQRAQRWLVEWGGHAISYDGRIYYDFPAPVQIAAATVETLTPLKITFRRMQAMIDLSAQVEQGVLDLEGLLVMPVEAAYAALVALKGIGHWTAAWTLQRAQGPHNYVGYNDVALQAAVNHYFYGGEGRITAQQVSDTFARYGDYAGIAAHHTMLRWVLDRY